MFVNVSKFIKLPDVRYIALYVWVFEFKIMIACFPIIVVAVAVAAYFGLLIATTTNQHLSQFIVGFKFILYENPKWYWVG